MCVPLGSTIFALALPFAFGVAALELEFPFVLPSALLAFALEPAAFALDAPAPEAAVPGVFGAGACPGCCGPGDAVCPCEAELCVDEACEEEVCAGAGLVCCDHAAGPKATNNIDPAVAINLNLVMIVSERFCARDAAVAI